MGVTEHALRYRLYHARARQVQKRLPSVDLSYEGLAEDIDGELARLFAFLGMEPMRVAELRDYFDQEWHFMGNASLFDFDGTIRGSRHNLGHLASVVSSIITKVYKTKIC